MRVAALATVLALAVTVPIGTARAQGHDTPAGNKGYKTVPLNLHKEQLGGAELPGIGRSRMRSGDYAGALDAFDVALRTSNDPTVHRDRGLCHEQLGNDYPAIDDYRFYLTAMPDAPDADGIARRLRALEDKVSGKKSSSSSSASHDDDTPPGMSASASIKVGSSGGSASASTSGSGSGSSHGSGKGATSSDKLDYVAPDDDALNNPYRAGKGVSLAPFFAEHKWISGSAFQALSDSQTWSEAFGIQARYSLNEGGAVVGELGYEYFNATSVDTLQISGLTSLLGYELRFKLDPVYDNQIFVTAALGFEHISVTFAGSSAQPHTAGAFVPRVRIGFRHMIEASTALDVSLDGGIASFFAYDKFPYDSTSTASGLIALNLSVGWGL
jgi:hypothetical protein